MSEAEAQDIELQEQVQPAADKQQLIEREVDEDASAALVLSFHFYVRCLPFNPDICNLFCPMYTKTTRGSEGKLHKF